MGGLAFPLVIIVFLISAAVTWYAGISLAKTTDTLDTRFKIGDALGGLILLGIAGTLPEIAVVASAAVQGHIPVIIGNLIGGISIQTLVIVLFDLAVRNKKPLSYLAGSVILSIETTFAIVITALALLGIFIPASKAVFHLNPASIAIVIAWLVGLFLIDKAREHPRLNVVAGDASPGRKHKERRKVKNHPLYANKSTLYVALVFLVAAAATLVAGVLLEETGSDTAARLGINSGIFAATVLALATTLPEISTGLESIFIGDNHLAISDILGGNAFMMVVFFMADLIAKKPVLSFAGSQDILFVSLGIGMMTVYAISFLVRLKRRYFKLGPDSIFEILLYAVGVAALLYVK
jgi:cation:H+ antiporter